MANEEATSGTVCFTKKRIRLSRVVDKLAILGNGNLIADRENNNIPGPRPGPAVSLLQAPSAPRAIPPPLGVRALPQLGAAVPDMIPILPESGSTLLQSYFMYSVQNNVPPSFLALPQAANIGDQMITVNNYPSAVHHTVTSASYGNNDYFHQARSPLIEESQFEYIRQRSEEQNIPPLTIRVNGNPQIKEEINNAVKDNRTNGYWNQAPEIKSEFKHTEIHQYQQAPLDLSVKGCSHVHNKVQKLKRSNVREPKYSAEISGKGKVRQSRPPLARAAYPVVRGDVASPTTRESVAARYNLQVSPVVEQMPLGSDTAWACPVCGQLFSQRDRLAKHVASRHRGRSPSRSHICHKCNRGFSRSDMLTRHLRLHTGQKPYRCGTCGQIFSRSDHLATHRRTHTGEKPYKCPQCPYAACRRDMITRHMRTHRGHSRSTSEEEMINSS